MSAPCFNESLWLRVLSRGLFGAVRFHAGGSGNPSSLHGAAPGPVHEERAGPSPKKCLPTLER